LGGLDWQTTEEKLVEHFSKYGEIVDYTIMKDNATGRSRGFGFLTFKDPASVDALLKDRHILDGKLIDPKRAISKEDQEKVGKIFIGGIDPMVTEREFDEFFSQFGKIIDCQLMIDKDTGRSRGFGFITYDSPAAVDRVCVNKYLTLKGKAMEVKRAAPRGQHNQQVAAQQAAAAHQAQVAAAQQAVPMYPYGAAGAGGAAAGYPMMNPATMNQDYMRYYNGTCTNRQLKQHKEARAVLHQMLLQPCLLNH
jgi:RNA-binding protein Musashi